MDPQRDVRQYLDDSRRLGVNIRHVFLTHFYADFLAGYLELRDAAEARIRLRAKAKAEFDFAAEMDGSVLSFGDVRPPILEAPGHTPEMNSLVVYDLAKSADRPHSETSGGRTSWRRSARPGTSWRTCCTIPSTKS